MIAILRYVGFYVSWGKVCSPSRIVTFLGIIVDSTLMEFRLPTEKLEKMKTLLCSVNNAISITKKDLEVLCGVLAHCATIVFCRRLYDLFKLMGQKNLTRISIPAAARQDIQWWFKFSHLFNGRAAISNDLYPDIMVSDSSMRGFGVFLGADWIVGTWPDVPPLILETDCNHISSAPIYGDTDYSNINELELWPILLGLHHWYPLLRGKSLRLLTDNTQVMGLLRKGSSTNATCMNWVREIFWVCVIHDIQLQPEYISTNDNVLADALSRLAYDTKLDHKVELLMTNLCCAHSLIKFACRLGRVGDSSSFTDTTVSEQSHSND